MIGGALGGAIDGPIRNTQALIDDLNAIKFDYGSAIPRIYGRYRVKISPMWSSIKRPVPHEEEIDEKGGPAAVNKSWTYEQDWLCWAPLGATGFSRVWENGEIVYSLLTGSSLETVDASLATTRWQSISFFDGNAAQLPWPIYEAAVGTANASAYRDRPTLAIGALDEGPSGQPPLIEVEFYSAAVADDTQTVSTVYEVSFGDTSGVDSGIAAFIGGDGHIWYAGKMDGSGLPATFNTVEYDPALPPPHLDLNTGSFPSGGNPTGIVNGMSDENYYMVGWLTGFTQHFQDSFGASYPSDPWLSIYAYARYNSVTLGLLAAPNQGIARLGEFGDSFTSTAYAPYSAALVAGDWYVAPASANGSIYRYDFETLAANGTITDPRGGGGQAGGVLATDLVTGELYFLYGTDLLKWNGTTWDVHFSSLPAEMRGMVSNIPKGITVENGVLYSIHRMTSSSPWTYRVSRCGRADTIAPQPVSLADIVRSEALLEWSGEPGALTADDIDVSELEDIEVTGFATTGSPREAIAQLMDMFYFGCVCSDKLYFRLRGAAAIDTVPFSHTGIGIGQPGEPFSGVDRGNDLEVPVQVAVTGPNLLADYDMGTESSDRLVGESVELRRYTTPVVMLPTERKGRADTMVMDARAASHTAQISLDDRHVEKEPFDVVNHVDDEGTTYRLRYDSETYADGVHTFAAVLDDPSVLSSVGITSETDLRAITVTAPPDTLAVPLDIPNLQGEPIGRGLYVAAKGVPAAGWNGYSFRESADDVTYSTLISATKATVLGECSVVPGNFTGGRVFDEFDSIVVDVGEGTLASSTRDAVIADQTVNAFAIGEHGRWLLGQFRDATLQGSNPNVYKLTGLILGSLGTEQHIGTQVAGDTFVLLKATGGIVRAPQAAIDQGALRYWTAISVGKAMDSSSSAQITQHEVGLMPLSPWDVRIARDTSANATITWQRRTRMATRFSGPSAPIFPIGEESEAYSVDVFSNGTYTTVVRTLASSTPTVAYSASDQTTDLGAPQATLYVQVYQLSAVVGRGFPAQKAA